MKNEKDIKTIGRINKMPKICEKRKRQKPYAKKKDKKICEKT